MTEEPRFAHEAHIDDIRDFTDAIINGRPEDYLEAVAWTLTTRHQLTTDELKDLVYGRLLLLARFCCCHPESPETQQCQ